MKDSKGKDIKSSGMLKGNINEEQAIGWFVNMACKESPQRVKNNKKPTKK